MKKGLLLVNLGTPDSPSPADVGKYLTEFLGDPHVIDIPAPLRWVLVNLMIVPRRKFASAELYQKVWTDKGSPLMIHTEEMTAGVRAKLPDYQVEFCMRYGNPRMDEVLARFKGIQDLTVFPLYPQYSLAATESSVLAIHQRVNRVLGGVNLTFVPPFYDKEAYIDAVAKVSGPQLEAFDHDHVLFSYHGLPERQVKKLDETKRHCLASDDCCDRIVDANKDCYRAQCYETTRLLVKKLGLSSDQYSVAFQSRLKGSPWIRPFSDVLYEELPKQGKKRLAVLCPSFVADCLETVEEVAIRGRKQFLAAGGEELRLVTSLNSSAEWIDAVVTLSSTNPKRTQKSMEPQSWRPTLQ